MEDVALADRERVQAEPAQGLAHDDPAGDDHRRPVRMEARHAFSHCQRHERQALHLSLDRLERQAVAVDPVAVVLLHAELDRGQAGDRPRDADRVVDDEILRDRGRDMPGAAPSWPRTADRRAGTARSAGRSRCRCCTATADRRGRDDELGRAAADVEDERRALEPPVARDAAKRQLGLVLAAEELGREAVAPLDLTEERLAVLRVRTALVATRSVRSAPRRSASRR